MKKITLFLLLVWLHTAVFAQTNQSVADHYTKIERYITMRDGVKLFTAIYIPKDASTKNIYPMLMQRTCYSVAPYGENQYPKALGYNPYRICSMKNIFMYIKMCVEDI